jgi:aldehyde:ferredoxin oxidoreductase
MKGGYTGKVLRVDLAAGKVRTEPLREDWAHDFIGARGLATRYLASMMDPTVDPLSPANPLIFATGPLTGTNSSCGARYVVTTKGPLTNRVTCSNSGGHFGPELKFAGYDMVIFEGKSPKPVYLMIYDDEVELVPAGHLWGKGVWDTEDTIRTESGVPDAIVAAIGQAGENLVKYACVVNDRHRAAGRSGVGAVMGSKNLKAIAVKGTGGVALARPREFMAASWAMKLKLKTSPVTASGLPTFGTGVLMNVINEVGSLPTNNFQEAQFKGAEDISGEAVTSTRLVANKACFACTIACGRVTALPGEASDKYALITSPRNWKIAGEGPEYENAWSLGADTGISDLDALIKAGWLCNDYGMDPITLGATVAAAMEMYQRGIINDAKVGRALPWGSAEGLLALTEAAAFRRGFGDEIAEGSARMTEKHGCPELFMGVRKQEFPAYDPRGIQGMGLAYATSNRGACHLKAYMVAPEILGSPVKMDPWVTEGKAAMTRGMQDGTAVVDSTGLCLFLTFGVTVEDMLPQLVAATGIDYTMESLLKAGERVWNLERIWNERAAGDGGKDDTLPKRMTHEGIPSGPTKGMVSKLGEMLPEYYKLRGWTPEGKPTKEKLVELGLELM